MLVYVAGAELPAAGGAEPSVLEDADGSAHADAAGPRQQYDSALPPPTTTTTAHTRTDIWGLSPVLVAVGITVTGVMFRVVLGMLNKRRRDFEPRVLVQSFILGWFASIGLVVGSVQHIPLDAPDLVIFQLLVGETATVMGIDAAGYSASKRISERRNGNGKPAQSHRPPPAQPPPTGPYGIPLNPY